MSIVLSASGALPPACLGALAGIARLPAFPVLEVARAWAAINGLRLLKGI
jgi:hypothetical protein